MEKQLKCVSMLTLLEMALRRVTIQLSNGSEILTPIPPRYYDTTYLETFEYDVKYKISKLLLPESLKKNMIAKVIPIGLQIGKWKLIHQRFLGGSTGDIGLPVKFYWTTAGTIDYKETVNSLLRCDALDAMKRYELACSYCLEDYIPLLWEELTEDKKEIFRSNTRCHTGLKFCWPHILKGELSELDCLCRISDRNFSSFNQWAFEDSVRKDNQPAAEYFFGKLTHEEKEASLSRSTLAALSDLEKWKFSAVLSYLLPLMTPELQMEIIRTHPVDVLFHFFKLPWQDLLLENAELIWYFLPASGYNDLTGRIKRAVYSDHHFLIYFREFFIMSPLTFKKYFPRRNSESLATPAILFLCMCFRNNDSEPIEVLFRNIDAADRVALVLKPDVLNLFYAKFFKGRQQMVEVCLREAKLSKEDRERLKAFFIQHYYRTSQTEKENSNLKRFFEFLDETYAIVDEEKKGQKRKLENCCSE